MVLIDVMVIQRLGNDLRKNRYSIQNEDLIQKLVKTCPSHFKNCITSGTFDYLWRKNDENFTEIT